MTGLWFLYLTHHLSLPFFSAESRSPPLLFLPLTSLQPDGRGASGWVAGWHRPISNSPPAPDQDDAGRGNNNRVRENHLNHPQHFSRWQPTGSTNCVTWPSSPVPCTRSPLTPCGATPPLTYWPVATSLAGMGQIFPKRWLHCVSNTKQQLTNNKQLWILAYIYTYIFNQLKAKIHIPSPTTQF